MSRATSVAHTDGLALRGILEELALRHGGAAGRDVPAPALGPAPAAGSGGGDDSSDAEDAPPPALDGADEVQQEALRQLRHLSRTAEGLRDTAAGVDSRRAEHKAALISENMGLIQRTKDMRERIQALRAAHGKEELAAARAAAASAAAMQRGRAQTAAGAAAMQGGASRRASAGDAVRRAACS